MTELEPHDKSKYMKVVKVPLKKILRNPKDQLLIIKEKVTITHQIAIHTFHFMKLYLLDFYKKKKELPVIDEKFITQIIKTICVKTETRGRPTGQKSKDIRAPIQKFYEDHYKELRGNEELNGKDLGNVIHYLTTEILTVYENNIKQHFVEYLERYVNFSFGKDYMMDYYKHHYIDPEERKKVISEFCSRLRKIKNDFINKDEPKTSAPKYHRWIDEKLPLIMPQRPYNRSLFYDIKASPQDYLPGMIYMMEELKKGQESPNNVFPLRSSNIPKYMTLDTLTLIRFFFTSKDNQQHAIDNLVKLKQRLWNLFFKLNKRVYRKKNYNFTGMIKTDGDGASLYFLRKNMEKPPLHPKKVQEFEEAYISDDLGDAKLEELRDKTTVAIDPGMSDLLYCISRNEDGTIKTLRYTQDQRRKETLQKKYRSIRESRKNTIVEGKTVQQWENELSLLDKKTLDFDEFKEYVRKKNRLNQILQSFYEEEIYRKLRFYSYINIQKTESRFMNKFKETFGPSETTSVSIGDWDQYKHRKYHEPVKGIGFRKMMRKAGYELFLVDEFRTSCRCCHCESDEGECEKFRVISNPRPWKRHEKILRHGLVKCKTCSRLWNRDKNGAINILKIAQSHINGLQRPSYLERN